MDEATLVELLPSVGLAIALAACAGVRAWLPLLLAGGLSRAGLLELGDAFAFLSTDKALVLFGLATVLEITADKIPALDHALDALSTVLRPAAGALLAASVIGRFADPLTALALGVAVGAPASLVPHAAKSTLRAAASTLTAGLANPVISLLEDLLAIVMFVLAVLVPIAVALVLCLASYFIARRLFRRPAPAARAA
ncbi:MAG TPA: DUF4126 domain-containing protein [Solirubrobacterales bacterium]|nr:DUF4126 domain-containing protein [Solirubrobacterales bacterium]